MDKRLVIGSIFGIVSVIIALSAYTISIILFPGGYDFLNNMISELGIGPYGYVFNLGLIFSGIVAIPHYLALVTTFDDPDINPRLKQWAIFFSFFSIITFIFIGVFPAWCFYCNPIVYLLHGTFALLAMSSGVCYLITFSLLMSKDPKYTKLQEYHGFIVAGTYLLFLLTWIPITEWIATFAITSWVISNSLFMLFIKE
jgi:hypothetical protein